MKIPKNVSSGEGCMRTPSAHGLLGNRNDEGISVANCEDWGAVVCDEPSATSDPTGSHTRRQRLCPDCRLGTQPGHLPGFRAFHEDSCFQNSVQLLQSTASAPVYSAILQSLVVSLVLSRLDYGNATWSRVEQTPVSPEQWWANLKSNLSKISNLLHWRFKSSRQISNLESNLTPKSWILKLQISNQISNPETTKRL